jgi:hypothetical protein
MASPRCSDLPGGPGCRGRLLGSPQRCPDGPGQPGAAGLAGQRWMPDTRPRRRAADGSDTAAAPAWAAAPVTARGVVAVLGMAIALGSPMAAPRAQGPRTGHAEPQATPVFLAGCARIAQRRAARAVEGLLSCSASCSFLTRFLAAEGRDIFCSSLTSYRSAPAACPRRQLGTTWADWSPEGGLPDSSQDGSNPHPPRRMRAVQ